MYNACCSSTSFIIYLYTKQRHTRSKTDIYKQTVNLRNEHTHIYSTITSSYVLLISVSNRPLTTLIFKQSALLSNLNVIVGIYVSRYWLNKFICSFIII